MKRSLISIFLLLFTIGWVMAQAPVKGVSDEMIEVFDRVEEPVTEVPLMLRTAKSSPAKTTASLPYSMGFETDETLDWVVENTNEDATTWGVAASNPRTGTYALRYTYNSANPGNDYAFTPLFTFEEGKTYAISFWVRRNNTYGTEKLALYILNDQASTAKVGDYLWYKESFGTTYEQISVVLSGYPAGSYCLGFYVYSAAYQYGIHVDDVEVVHLPDIEPELSSFLMKPKYYETGMRDINVLLKNNSWDNLANATINWTVNGVAQPAYTLSEAIAGTGEKEITIGQYNFTANGTYTLSATVVVEGDEVPGNNTATTEVIISDAEPFPYSTQFDGGNDYWEGEAIAGNYPFAWTGEDTSYCRVFLPSKENGFMWMYGAATNVSGTKSTLTSPPINFATVSAGTNIGMKFAMSARFQSASHTLKVQTSTDGFVNDIQDVWVYTGGFTVNTYLVETHNVNLSSLAGSNAQVRFYYEGTGSYGWAVDDIEIKTITPSDDVAIRDARASFTYSSAPTAAGVACSFVAEVINYGTQDYTNLPVKMTIAGQEITQTIASLKSGNIERLIFTWAEEDVVAGIHEVVFSLPGDQNDSNSANDTFILYKAVAETVTQQGSTGFTAVLGEYLTEGLNGASAAFPPVRWTNPGGWARSTNSSYRYEGAACAIVTAAPSSELKFVTPLLHIDENNHTFLFHSIATSYGANVSIQLMYSADRESWTAIGAPANVDVYNRAYKVDVSALIGGQYYFAFAASAGGGEYVVALDYIYAPKEARYNVTFNVTKPDGGPAVYASVQLFEGETEMEGSPLVTDETGSASLVFDKGTYSADIFMSGYLKETVEFTVNNADIIHNIELTYNSEEEPNPPLYPMAKVEDDLAVVSWYAPNVTVPQLFKYDTQTAFNTGTRYSTAGGGMKGNKYTNSRHGHITEAYIYTFENASYPSDGGTVTIDIYNTDEELLGSSGAIVMLDYQWVTVPFEFPVEITDDFMVLVTWQPGAPATAWLAIETNSPSVDYAVSYNGTTDKWVYGMPATGESVKGIYAVRALAQMYTLDGVMEPVMFGGNDDNGDVQEAPSRGLTSYSVYRVLDGEEFTEEDLIVSGITDALSYTDEEWETLPLGTYRYGVSATYSLAGESDISPSINTLQKELLYNYTINITTSEGISPVGATITMTNLDDPTEVYSGTSDATGITFAQVPQGAYRIFIQLENFDNYSVSNITVDSGNLSHDALLMITVEKPVILDVVQDGKDAVFTWEAASEAQSTYAKFSVYLGNDLVASGLTTTEYRFTNLDPGSYRAGVRAVYSMSESTIVTKTFDIAPVLYTVTFEVVGNNQTVLEGALVQVSGQGSGGNTNASGILVYPTKLQDGAYTVSVSKEGYDAVDKDFTVNGADLTVNVSLDAVGIGKAVINAFAVYPNPVNDHLTLERESGGKATVEIYNSNGVRVQLIETSKRKESINVSNLSPGAYIIRVMDGDKVNKIQSFIKK